MQRTKHLCHLSNVVNSSEDYYERLIEQLQMTYAVNSVIAGSKRKKEKKAIPVTGRGGLQGCEMLRVSHCLHNRLTDGVKVVSLTHQPRPTSQKHYFSASGTHFC
jgi:hypothetical protein